MMRMMRNDVNGEDDNDDNGATELSERCSSGLRSSHVPTCSKHRHRDA